MADSNENKTPDQVKADRPQEQSALEPTQNEEKRELSDFEQAAEEGRKTAETNLAAEAEENGDAKPGNENVTEKVTTSEAQTELRADDDPATVKAKEADKRLGDDKAAQKSDAALKVGRKTAETNLAAEADEQPEGKADGTDFDQAIEEGLSAAEKNHKAEVAANKAANAR